MVIKPDFGLTLGFIVIHCTCWLQTCLNYVKNKQIIVAQAMRDESITFRRCLYEDMRNSWENIWEDASNFQLGSEADIVTRRNGKNGKFTVKSMYSSLISSEKWHLSQTNLKIPAKIKIFLWLMSNDAILTKEGDPRCTFCDKY